MIHILARLKSIAAALAIAGILVSTAAAWVYKTKAEQRAAENKQLTTEREQWRKAYEHAASNRQAQENATTLWRRKERTTAKRYSQIAKELAAFKGADNCADTPAPEFIVGRLRDTASTTTASYNLPESTRNIHVQN